MVIHGYQYIPVIININHGISHQICDFPVKFSLTEFSHQYVQNNHQYGINEHGIFPSMKLHQ